MSVDIDICIPNLFFNIDAFRYKFLFEIDKPIWECLDSISSYLKNNEIIIGKNCKINPNSCIEGPCIIGDNCEIRFNAYIRGQCIVGDNCIIGHSAELVRCIVMNNTKLSHMNYVGDSVIGNNVNFGAGSICANTRLDRSPISIVHNGKKYETGRKKFGAIIGDNSSVGCNAVLNPGTVLFPNTKLYPCSVSSGVILR